MTLLHFRSLSGDVQRMVVQHSGVFRFGRTCVGVTAKLYCVDSFYVELCFDGQMSKVIRLVSFDDPSKLEPYLRQVDLREVQVLLG